MIGFFRKFKQSSIRPKFILEAADKHSHIKTFMVRYGQLQPIIMVCPWQLYDNEDDIMLRTKQHFVQFLIILFFTSFLSNAGFAETLRMFVWEGYAPEKHRQAFIHHIKEKYGVTLTLDITHVTSDDEFFPMLRDDRVDIISPVHSLIKDRRFQFIKHNLVLPLNLDNIPNYSKVLPALKKAEYCTANDKVYAVPIARGPYGLAYNTEKIKDAPTSWNILWDPRYRGKYTLGRETYVENINLTALAMGIHPDKISDYRTLNTPEFQKRLSSLAVNAHSMWEGVDKASDLNGLALAGVWGPSLVELKAMGANWKMAEPREGTPAWVDNLLISYSLEKKPLMRKIAEEWLNYALSDTFQIYLTHELMWTTISTTVKNQLSPETVQRLHLDDPTHFKTHRHLLKRMKKLDRKGLKRLWNMALEKHRKVTP